MLLPTASPRFRDPERENNATLQSIPVVFSNVAHTRRVQKEGTATMKAWRPAPAAFLAAGIASLVLVTTMLVAAGTARAADATLSLDGNDWRICADKAGTGEEKRLFDAAPTGADWLPASVPGNIQADLEAAHRLPPLWYGESIRTCTTWPARTGGTARILPSRPTMPASD